MILKVIITKINNLIIHYNYNKSLMPMYLHSSNYTLRSLFKSQQTYYT